MSRGKKVLVYNNIKFDNFWELDFYKWCEKNNVNCVRNTTGFYYEFNGPRTYYPDFYLPDISTYVEVKGRETEKDLAKWKYFKFKLIKVRKKEIDMIRKNMYNLPVED